MEPSCLQSDIKHLIISSHSAEAAISASSDSFNVVIDPFHQSSSFLVLLPPAFFTRSRHILILDSKVDTFIFVLDGIECKVRLQLLTTLAV